MMRKNNTKRSLLIIAPPLILILVGVAVYISVIKLLTPQLETISAVPDKLQSTSSAEESSSSASSTDPINPINTEVNAPSNADIEQWQADVKNGKDVWRLDPVSAAENLAGVYGFIPGDQLTLVTDEGSTQPISESATIIALHGPDTYVITLVQPNITGPQGIWVIRSIEKQS